MITKLEVLKVKYEFTIDRNQLDLLVHVFVLLHFIVNFVDSFVIRKHLVEEKFLEIGSEADDNFEQAC